jgi:putative oxygen-independent coproporphyrinogen III oxidase
MSSHFESEPLSVYIHFPFCKHRCAYCDFVTFAGRDFLIPGYLNALRREINDSAQMPVDRSVHSIYLGGGTPSLLGVDTWGTILGDLFALFDVRENSEITLEMNPGTIDQKYLLMLRKLRINRLSIGMQSAVDRELALLGRIHGFTQFCETVRNVKAAGFQNFSFDLIYGIPEQTLKSWDYSIQRALEFSPPHLSLYSLTIEEGTPFAKQLADGTIQSSDDDLMADMYDLAMDTLASAGYVQYEISNWAMVRLDGSLNSCRHNLQYWRNLPYLGLGPGAHGCISGKRIANTTSIEDYIQRSKNENKRSFPLSFATDSVQELNRDDEMDETMMLGLRLTEEGVSELEFGNRFGTEPGLCFGKIIDTLVSQGLLERLTDSRRTIRLTRRGRLLGNQVFMQFVGD